MQNSIFIQWQCPDCLRLNSYEVFSKDKIERVQQNGYTQLHEGSLPYCENCHKFFYLWYDHGKITAK